jgi:hypothetical protein
MAKGLELLKKLSKGATVGGLTGYVSSRTTSSSAEAPDNSLMGAKVGAALGTLLPALGTKTVRKGIASGAQEFGKVVFRRIRGKIIPIRAKK